MTLKELGEQYNEAYCSLMKRINELRKTVDELSGNEKIAEQRRILSLYNDALYCRKIYEKLVNYYKK